MAYTITIANAKGGCGKNTVALNLAICFSRAGYRTLAIDLDQQGNLSAGLGVDLNKLSLTAHRLLINEAPEIRRCLVEIRPQLYLLPNSIDVSGNQGASGGPCLERIIWGAWQMHGFRDRHAEQVERSAPRSLSGSTRAA
jgi:cellulose biosynthesis protein BcsQ